MTPCCWLRTSRLPEGDDHVYELKYDGYRSIAFKHAGKVHLRSRSDKDFNARYPAIISALTALPDETVIDGEIVPMDEAGRPSFNVLQNYGSSKAPSFYYVFDVLILEAFLSNHREVIVAFDFFTVPSLTFKLLYCFLIIEHGRRKILHCNVTTHPTSLSVGTIFPGC